MVEPVYCEYIGATNKCSDFEGVLIFQVRIKYHSGQLSVCMCVLHMQVSIPSSILFTRFHSTHRHTHAWTHACTGTHTHAQRHTRAHIDTHTHTHTHTHTLTHTHTHTCAQTHNTRINAAISLAI